MIQVPNKIDQILLIILCIASGSNLHKDYLFYILAILIRCLLLLFIIAITI